MTTVSLWNQGAETVTSSGAGNPGTNGLHFTVSAACALQGLWHYSPSGFSQTQLPTSIGLFNFTTRALIHSETVSSWSGAAGSGWVYAAFASPPQLAAGTGYMAAQYRDDAVNGWFVYDDAYAWPAGNGIITAPADTGAGQGWYVNTATGIAFPTSQLAGFNWWLDVQVSTTSPSTRPGKASAGRPSARKGSARGSGVGRLPYPAVAGNPVYDTAGEPVLDTAGLPVEDTGASVPSPFAQPGKGARGRALARKGQAAGSPGAKYAFAPPPPPAPFAQPSRATAGRPAARRGTAHAVNPGAPYAYVPVPPAPFTQPRRAVTGRRSARRGSAAGTRAQAWSPLVQETSGSTTGTSLTLTFPSATTVGNSVIIAVCGYFGGAVSTVTLGGGGSFSQKAASGSNNAQVWADLGVTASSATVVITTTTAGILAWAYEVAGNVAFDVSAANSGTGTSWSSGATGTTVPFGHFVVGLGTIVSSAGSIAGPGGAWTNEGAITDVVGAGGHAVGGVSGYQLPPSSGTYAYSGTSGTSSAWGAVTAAFAVIPFAPGVSFTGNWGGYAFYEHAAAGYTGITATFTIPAVSGGSFDSIWVGLGDVYQVGIYQTYESSGFSGNSSSRPWSWWLPGAGEDWNQAAYPTAYGDTLTLTMQLTATEWLMTISNATEGWTYTEARSVLSVNIGSIQNLGAGPASWPFPCGQAEVIIEREGVPLPHYGSIAFTSIATTPAATQLPSPVFTINSTVDQYPGAYNLAAGSFTMFWNAES